MKSLVLAVLVAFSFFGFANAQGNMAVGAGLVVSLPMGDFGDAANTGFGGTAAFELGFTPQLVGVGNIGYIMWGTDAEDFDFSAVPVLAGVKYYFMPGVGFYGLGQIGLTFLSASTPSFNFGSFEVESQSETSTEFTFNIGAGYEVPVSPTVSLDFTGMFNLISDANNIQLRAGAKFAL